ncbi:helix-turn-helix domain-containing protein [Streptomyces apocyni]|uniref:helix-turn-helix domain-containing protein n=1 Tax=Streptomyces apocyni TaxID=2654677 RepID=UPI001E33F006|nr:XRE family transcriptional regulator [Streptomyces apocyni]
MGTGRDGRGRDESSRRKAGPLVEHLRLLRQRSGLTLATLAGRTSYSKSSWERYLNGKALPSRQAIREFAQAVSVKPDRLLLLLDVAKRGQPDGNAPEHTDPADRPASEAAPAAPDPEPGLVPGMDVYRDQPSEESAPRAVSRRPRRWGVLLGSAIALGMAAGLLGGMLITARTSLGESMPERSAVKCAGFECRNKDAQRMECHIGVWTAAAEKVQEVYLELRYSPSCGAAWARITEGQIGDTARVEGKRDLSAARSISYDQDTYSPMIEAPYPAAVRACAVLEDGGTEVCTPRGGASPLPAAVTDERKP